MRKEAVVVLIFLCLAVPPSCAAIPDQTRQEDPLVTGPELNVTGADIDNNGIPAQYRISPTMIDIRVELSDTSLPGPKGEMAAGPRTIGFSADPVSLAILIMAIIAGTAGAGYLIRRKHQENGGEDK